MGRRYVIILADIPWDVRLSRGAGPYPLLSLEQILQFRVDDGRPIREVAADDAMLLLWGFDQLIMDRPDLFHVIARAWGDFRPIRFLFWPKSQMGTGHFFRDQDEFVVVCIRGNFRPPLEHLRPSSLIVGPPFIGGGGFHFAPAQDARHSSKPPRLQETIEQAYPEYFGPETIKSPLALELFARNYRPKWDGQGFEYPGRPADLAGEPDAEIIRIRHAEDGHPDGG
jgi:N6-adenosine-specific RNA methylase IME4